MPRNDQGGDATLARIHEVLDGIRTRLRLDEVDLAVVDMSEEGVLLLRFFGRHARCPVALATLYAHTPPRGTPLDDCTGDGLVTSVWGSLGVLHHHQISPQIRRRHIEMIRPKFHHTFEQLALTVDGTGDHAFNQGLALTDVSPTDETSPCVARID